MQQASLVVLMPHERVMMDMRKYTIGRRETGKLARVEVDGEVWSGRLSVTHWLALALVARRGGQADRHSGRVEEEEDDAGGGREVYGEKELEDKWEKREREAQDERERRKLGSRTRGSGGGGNGGRGGDGECVCVVCR